MPEAAPRAADGDDGLHRNVEARSGTPHLTDFGLGLGRRLRSDHLAENLTLLGDRGLVEIGPTPPGPRNPGGRYTLRARTGSFRFDSRQLTTRRAPRGQWAGLTAHREAFDRSGSARQRREARFVLVLLSSDDSFRRAELRQQLTGERGQQALHSAAIGCCGSAEIRRREARRHIVEMPAENDVDPARGALIDRDRAGDGNAVNGTVEERRARPSGLGGDNDGGVVHERGRDRSEVLDGIREFLESIARKPRVALREPGFPCRIPCPG